jgi:hypothetical protein
VLTTSIGARNVGGDVATVSMAGMIDGEDRRGMLLLGGTAVVCEGVERVCSTGETCFGEWRFV